VDKVVNNRLLTAENAFNGAGFNKMPNPQAEFLPIRINDLESHQNRPKRFSAPLEKYFFVHK
jgi:hypothetical protein